MNRFKMSLLIFIMHFCAAVQADMGIIRANAENIEEAQILVEASEFVREMNDKRKRGEAIDATAALEVEEIVEQIGIDGCLCEEDLNIIIRSQAYTIVGAINGILSKQSKNVIYGRKSFHSLERAREIFPDNTDAIKGQAIALNLILSENWFVRNMISIAIGVDLEEAQKELIADLRRFPERKDLQKLANQLEDKL